jgi:hypothetical protein
MQILDGRTPQMAASHSPIFQKLPPKYQHLGETKFQTPIHTRTQQEKHRRGNKVAHHFTLLSLLSRHASPFLRQPSRHASTSSPAPPKFQHSHRLAPGRGHPHLNLGNHLRRPPRPGIPTEATRPFLSRSLLRTSRIAQWRNLSSITRASHLGTSLILVTTSAVFMHNKKILLPHPQLTLFLLPFIIPCTSPAEDQ